MRKIRVLPVVSLAAALFGLAGAGRAEPPRLDPQDTRRILFAATSDAPAVNECADGDNRVRISCLITKRYGSDPKAARMAVELFERTGTVAGLLPEEDFDGGYRGVIHLVPDLPAGAGRKHLGFVAAALYGYDELFAAIEKQAGAPARYRWRDLAFYFFRSVKKRTPAAFAHGWTVSYNTNGSLNHSDEMVRELLFHEIFHLNDRDHGDWSEGALSGIFDGIVKRCGTSKKCLQPYAQGWVVVVGGTYYAFTPGNGVGEFAAEVAIQYLREQRTVLGGGKVKQPYKCGPPENGKAWDLLVKEFFAGVDLVPPCPP